MRWKTLSFVALTVACGAVAGCSHDRGVRSVYRDGRYGVIALEQDTKSTRKQAAKLMAEHFPDGYEIVREEEIDTGARKSDHRGAQSTSDSRFAARMRSRACRSALRRSNLPTSSSRFE